MTTKTDPKYKMALKFINKILVNTDKEEIDDLTKFTNIDRNLIITDKNKSVLIDMEKQIYALFDKTKSG